MKQLQKDQADTRKQTDVGRELAYKLKKAGLTMRRFRDGHLADDEWWQDESTKAIHWHKHAIEKLLVFLEEPRVVSNFITLTVRKPARNKKFAICAHEGKKVYVVLPRGLQKRCRKGQNIRVEVITDGNGERSYREQSLGR